MKELISIRVKEIDGDTESLFNEYNISSPSEYGSSESEGGDDNHKDGDSDSSGGISNSLRSRNAPRSVRRSFDPGIVLSEEGSMVSKKIDNTNASSSGLIQTNPLKPSLSSSKNPSSFTRPNSNRPNSNYRNRVCSALPSSINTLSHNKSTRRKRFSSLRLIDSTNGINVSHTQHRNNRKRKNNRAIASQPTCSTTHSNSGETAATY
ncbi:hypothetical protein Tco_0177182, partial [Tanacetum coccineum]